MLHPIVSARRPRGGRPGALALSVAAHIALIFALVTSRTARRSLADEPLRGKASIEQIHFLTAAPAIEPAPAAPPKPSRPARARPAAPRPAATPPPLPPPPATPPPTVPETPRIAPIVAPVSVDLSKSTAPAAPIDRALDGLDLTTRVTSSADFAAPTAISALASGLGRGVAPPNGGVYTPDMVERTVLPFANNPKPIYPPALLSARVEGQFVVHFVVDSTGRVDRKSVEFPSSAHRLFVAAVRRALERSRYRPAEVGGQPVAQLVEQQFTFRIER